MNIAPDEHGESNLQITASDFIEAYNKDLPANFPHLSEPLLKKFKGENPAFFQHGELWSLEEHRKKIIDWFQLLKLNDE
jgi:hypothetical protein